MAQSEGDRRFEKLLRAIGFAVLEVERATDPERNGGVELYDIRFKLDADNRTSVLCVLKGEEEDKALVAFVGGATLPETLLSVSKKLKTASVRWREDRPWGT